MSVAYERQPEWEATAAAVAAARAAARRHEVPDAGPATGRDTGRDSTVVAFPLRPAAPEPSQPAQSAQSAQSEPGGADGLAVPGPVGSADRLLAAPARTGSGLPGVLEMEPLLRPESRPARARTAGVRRGPRPCVASAPVLDRQPGLRLTARGRVVVRLLAAACALGVIALSAWIVTTALMKPVVPDSAPAVVVVQAGDSLWTIAHDIAPQSDPRKVVAALEERNHLDSPVVRVGQELDVPH